MSQRYIQKESGTTGMQTLPNAVPFRYDTVDDTLKYKNESGTIQELMAASAAGVFSQDGVNRAIFNPTAKTIVDGAATALFEVPLASGGIAAGIMHFAVVASDGTDHQVIAGIATYSAENKAGTLVGLLTYVAANEAKSVSSGTITLAFTDDDNADAARFLVQPTGSLTETTYTITYTLFPLIGTVTIL